LLIKVTWLRSGFIASPPGPRKRSREAISEGSLHKTGVPTGTAFGFGSFFFLGYQTEGESRRIRRIARTIDLLICAGLRMIFSSDSPLRSKPCSELF